MSKGIMREEYSSTDWMKLNYFVQKQIESKLETIDPEKIEKKFGEDVAEEVEFIQHMLYRGFNNKQKRKRCVHVIREMFKSMNKMLNWGKTEDTIQFSFRGFKL
jgi:hypothetical protein